MFSIDVSEGIGPYDWHVAQVSLDEEKGRPIVFCLSFGAK